MAKLSGVTRAKRVVSRKTGIPTTKSGRQRKIKGAASSGCLIQTMTLLSLASILLFTLLLFGCKSQEESENERLGRAFAEAAYDIPSFKEAMDNARSSETADSPPSPSPDASSEDFSSLPYAIKIISYSEYSEPTVLITGTILDPAGVDGDNLIGSAAYLHTEGRELYLLRNASEYSINIGDRLTVTGEVVGVGSTNSVYGAGDGLLPIVEVMSVTSLDDGQSDLENAEN